MWFLMRGWFMTISCIFCLHVWCKEKHRKLEFNSIKKDICYAMCNYNKVMNKLIDSSMGTKPMPFTCVQPNEFKR